MAGSAESIWMETVESSRASCSKMSIQFQGAMQMLLPLCSLLASVLIRAFQTERPQFANLACMFDSHVLIPDITQQQRAINTVKVYLYYLGPKGESVSRVAGASCNRSLSKKKSRSKVFQNNYYIIVCNFKNNIFIIFSNKS